MSHFRRLFIKIVACVVVGQQIVTGFFLLYDYFWKAKLGMFTTHLLFGRTDSPTFGCQSGTPLRTAVGLLKETVETKRERERETAPASFCNPRKIDQNNFLISSF